MILAGQIMSNEILKKITTPDERNEGITVELLDNELNKIPLSNKIPEDVANMIELSKKLCLYAYLEYDFYSVGAFYGFLSVESALKSKLDKKSGKFSDLFSLAVKQGFIPPRVQFLGESIRELRNYHAHPTYKILINPELVIISLLRIIDFINCLFDPSVWDKEPDILRQQREENERIAVEIKNLKK